MNWLSLVILFYYLYVQTSITVKTLERMKVGKIVLSGTSGVGLWGLTTGPGKMNCLKTTKATTGLVTK